MNKELEWKIVEEDGCEFWKAIVFCGEYTVSFSTARDGYISFLSMIPIRNFDDTRSLSFEELLKLPKLEKETMELAKEEAQEHWDKITNGCTKEEETGMKKYTAVGYIEKTRKKFIDHVWGLHSQWAFAVITHNRQYNIIVINIFEGHLNDIYDIEFEADLALRKQHG